MIETYYKENHEANFKDQCVSCGKSIPPTWEHYKLHGNFCEMCCNGAKQKADDKRHEHQEAMELERERKRRLWLIEQQEATHISREDRARISGR